MKNNFRLLSVLILLLVINGCSFTNAQRGHIALTQGRYDRVIYHYTEAIKSDNLSPLSLEDAYCNLGYAKYKEGDDDGAIADCNKAIEINSKSARGYFGRGVAKLDKNDFDGAIADLSKSIEFNQHDAGTYENRGLAKLRKNDFDGAIIDFTKNIEFDTKSPYGYSNRGWAKLAKFDYDAVINDFDKAIDLDSKFNSAFLGRGFSFFYTDRPDKAIADFEEAFKIDPNDYYALWLFIAKERNKQDGRTDLKNYRDKNIKDTSWPIPVIQLYLREITPEECLATSDHKDFSQDKKQKCEAYFYIAQFYLLHNDFKKAKEYLQKSLEVGHGTSMTITHQIARHELRKLNQNN